MKKRKKTRKRSKKVGVRKAHVPKKMGRRQERTVEVKALSWARMRKRNMGSGDGPSVWEKCTLSGDRKRGREGI